MGPDDITLVCHFDGELVEEDKIVRYNGGTKKLGVVPKSIGFASFKENIEEITSLPMNGKMKFKIKCRVHVDEEYGEITVDVDDDKSLRSVLRKSKSIIAYILKDVPPATKFTSTQSSSQASTHYPNPLINNNADNGADEAHMQKTMRYKEIQFTSQRKEMVTSGHRPTVIPTHDSWDTSVSVNNQHANRLISIPEDKNTLYGENQFTSQLMEPELRSDFDVRVPISKQGSPLGDERRRVDTTVRSPWSNDTFNSLGTFVHLSISNDEVSKSHWGEMAENMRSEENQVTSQMEEPVLLLATTLSQVKIPIDGTSNNNPVETNTTGVKTLDNDGIKTNRYACPSESKLKEWFPQALLPLITDYEDPEGDGNCGFRALCMALGKNESEWSWMRGELVKEIESNNKFYNKLFGLEETVKLVDGIWHSEGWAPPPKWMDMPSTGFVFAQAFKVVLVHYSKKYCWTFVPSLSPPNADSMDVKVLGIGYVENNKHYIKLDFGDGCPLPPLPPIPSRCKTIWPEITASWKKLLTPRLNAFMDMNIPELQVNKCPGERIDLDGVSQSTVDDHVERVKLSRFEGLLNLSVSNHEGINSSRLDEWAKSLLSNHEHSEGSEVNMPEKMRAESNVDNHQIIVSVSSHSHTLDNMLYKANQVSSQVCSQSSVHHELTSPLIRNHEDNEADEVNRQENMHYKEIQFTFQRKETVISGHRPAPVPVPAHDNVDTSVRFSHSNVDHLDKVMGTAFLNELTNMSISNFEVNKGNENMVCEENGYTCQMEDHVLPSAPLQFQAKNLVDGTSNNYPVEDIHEHGDAVSNLDMTRYGELIMASNYNPVMDVNEHRDVNCIDVTGVNINRLEDMHDRFSHSNVDRHDEEINLPVTVSNHEYDKGNQFTSQMEETAPNVHIETSARAGSSDIEFSIGREFKDIEAFRNIFSDWAVSTGYVYRTVRKTPSMLTMKCRSEGCDWRIQASKLPNLSTCKVIKYQKVHTCSGPQLSCAGGNHRQATKKWIVSKMQSSIERNPDMEPKKIVKEIKDKFGIEISYNKAVKAKTKALEAMRIHLRKSHPPPDKHLCRSLVQELRRGGSVAEHGLNSDGDSLEYLFWAFSPCIHALRTHLRPVLYVRTEDIAIGVLMYAHGVDGNTYCGNSIEVGFAVFAREDDKAWETFMRCLKVFVLPAADNNNKIPFAIVTDLKDTAIHAVRNVLPEIHHFFFRDDFSRAFSREFNSFELRSLCEEACLCFSTKKCEEHLQAIKSMNEKAYEWLLQRRTSQWSPAFSPNKHVISNPIVFRYPDFDLMLENKLSIVEIVESIRDMVANYFSERRIKGAERTTANEGWAPGVMADLSEWAQVSRDLFPDWEVESINGHKYQVTHKRSSNATWVVDLEERSCTCGRFQATEYPCLHAFKVLVHEKLDVKDYLSHNRWYSLDTYISTYAGSLPPPICVNVNLHRQTALGGLPPERRKVGRPTKLRKMSTLP